MFQTPSDKFYRMTREEIMARPHVDKAGLPFNNPYRGWIEENTKLYDCRQGPGGQVLKTEVRVVINENRGYKARFDW